MNQQHPSERQDPSLGRAPNALVATRCYFYPVALVAGLALSAAGAGMQVAGANKARNSMDEAQAAELLRQKKFQDTADAAFQQNLSKSKRDTAELEQDAGAQRRTDEYAKIEQSGAGVAPITATASGSASPNSAAGAAARNKAVVQATGNAWSKLVGDARAKLGGGDDWQLNQGFRNTKTNQDLALTSSAARGSANILPYEMNDASHRGDALKGWGQLVGALGAVTGMAGATAGAAAPTVAKTGWSAVNWSPEMAASLGSLA